MQLTLKLEKYLSPIKYSINNNAMLDCTGSEGVIGLINVNNTHRAAKVSVATFIKSTNKKNMKIVEEHDSRQGKPQKNSVSKF